MFDSLFLIKFVVAISVILLHSIIAESVSPRLAGILAGFPTGTAITLFFFGLEIGPRFASESALFNMSGLVATQILLYVYSRCTSLKGPFLPALLSITGYLIVIMLLRQAPTDNRLPIVLPLLLIPLLIWFYRETPNSIISRQVRRTPLVLLVRSLVASSIILTVTGFARSMGPVWAGLWSAFPTTVFPLLIIIHFTYGKAPVQTIIKNTPIGQISLLIYSFTVFLSYPAFGIVWGTLLAFGSAIGILLAYKFIEGKVTPMLRRQWTMVLEETKIS